MCIVKCAVCRVQCTVCIMKCAVAVCSVQNCAVVGGGQECIYQEFIVEGEGGATCLDILGVMRHWCVKSIFNGFSLAAP